MLSSAIIFVGIDVSKDELVIACGDKGQIKKCKISNTVDSIFAWLKDFGVTDKHFVLEHTGVYSHRLIYVLSKHDAVFSLINPAQSRAMSKVLGKTHKNDDQDAQTLILLGQKFALKPYIMPDAAQKKRKEAFSALNGLQKQRGQLENMLHSFDYRADPNPVVVEELKKVLKSLDESVAVLEKEILPHPDGSAEDDEKRILEIMNLIMSIKGVGTETAKACITLFGDFSRIESAKAFVKTIGLSPTEYSSGSSVRGKTGISKRGNPVIRSLLFNCARSAIRYNPICKELYDRLVQKGKKGGSALVAVMHKLARQIYGVIKSNQPFDENFVKNKQIVTV